MSKSGASPTATSPPSGGAFSSGLGESFSLDLNSGQATYSVAFEVVDGLAGLTPRLKLEYVHGLGQGPFGLGWHLPVRAIERRLEFGVPGQGTVERFRDGPTEIVEIADGTFRAAFEAAFARYERHRGGWRVLERDGTVHVLGTKKANRIAHPDHPDRVQTWLLETTRDPSGNEIGYAWDVVEGVPYLRRVRYAVFRVVFRYERRPDTHRDGRAGFLRTTKRRCTSVEYQRVDLGDSPIRLKTWTLGYEQAPGNGTSLLTSIQLTAHGLIGDGSDDVVNPPLQLGYSRFDPRDISVDWMDAEAGEPPVLGNAEALIALDDLPLPGVLRVTGGRQVYWPNRGDGTWGAPRPVTNPAAIADLASAGVGFVDMDGSGTSDMLVTRAAAPINGFYRNGGSRGWTDFVAYPRRADVGPRWETGDARAFDVNGDGVVDAVTASGRVLVAYRNNGGDGWAPPYGTDNAAPDLDLGSTDVFVADMTGDGAPDLVRVRSGNVTYWPNLGDGEFGDPITMADSPRLRKAALKTQEFALVDVDGDGCADLVRVSANGLQIWINRGGEGFAPPVERGLIPTPVPGTLHALDINGRGMPALLWNSRRSSGNGFVYATLAAKPPPAMLTTIDNGRGLTSEIRYGAAVDEAIRDRDAGSPWHTTLPFPLWVVTAIVETEATRGLVTETRYRYHQGHFDGDDRRFAGFGHVDKIEVGDGSRSDVVYRHEFNQRQAFVPGNGPEHGSIDRTLARVEVLCEDGSPDADRPYSVEETDYDVAILDTDTDGRPTRVFRFVTATRRIWSERSSDERIEERTYSYDPAGNVDKETFVARGTRDGAPVTTRQVETSFTYASDGDGELTRNLATIVKRDGGGTLIGETHRHYDGPDFVGRNLGSCTRGLLTRELRLVDAAATFDTHYAGLDSAALGYVRATNADGASAVFLASERHRYDARGMVTGDRDGIGNDTTYTYDTSGLFQATHTDTVGTTTMTHDVRTGKQTSVATPDGTTTDMTYDGMGRITAAAMGADTLADPTRIYTYDDLSVPNAQTTTYRVDNGSQLTTTSYRDGRNKTLQQRVRRAAGQVIVSGHTEMNPWGQTIEEFEPSLATDLAYAPGDTTGSSRRVEYDGPGRPVRTLDYRGGVSSVSFTPFELIRHDANDSDASPENIGRGQFNTPRREVVDAMNYRVAVIDQAPDGSDVIDSFDIGPLGELREHRDGSGPVASYRYDLLGRRIDIDHRDAGRRRLWYDANGHVVRYVDATGTIIESERDGAGRISRLLIDGAESERFVYDDLTRGAWGRLSEVHYPAGSQRFTYNPQGQVIRHDFLFDGHPAAQTMQFEYNAMGKTTAVVYPDGQRVTYEHDLNGSVRRIPGFINAITYDARQLPTHIEYANGVTTDITYTPGPGKVKTQKTVSPTGTRLQDAVYEYDQLAMVLSAADTAPGATFTANHEYDTLYQLTRAHGMDAGNTYDHGYAHIHDRALASLGESGATMTFTDASTPTRPSTVQTGSAPATAITYDANGAMTGLPGRTLAYNAKGQLARVDRDNGVVAHYDYDYKGNRIRKRVIQPGGAELVTLFIGPFAEIRGTVMAKYVRWGRTKVALVRDGSTRFIHLDRIGSATFFTDATGRKVARTNYRPYGNVGSTTGTEPYQSYGLHEFDEEAGLFFTGRRAYAPEIGRFTTPDPLYLFRPHKGADDPRTLALYTYVGNDPVDNIDPNGLSFWSVLGAIVGVIVGVVVAALVVAAFATGIGAGILALIGLIAVVTAAYMGVNAVDANSPLGEFMRGFLIGMNAGMNAVFATVIFGPVVGVALGVIVFLGAFDSIAESEIYQGILGWSNWIMPMSWLVVGLGLLFFVANLIGHVFGWWIAGDEDWRVLEFRIDWQTGTITTRGGAVSNANQWDTAFNMGNFAFADRLNANWEADIDHEIGHSLNLAAFGSVFHFVGFFDEFVFGNGESAYAERLADGNDPATTNPDVIPMWNDS